MPTQPLTIPQQEAANGLAPGQADQIATQVRNSLGIAPSNPGPVAPLTGRNPTGGDTPTQDAQGNPIVTSGVRRYTGGDAVGGGNSTYDQAANDYFTTGAGANRAPVDQAAIRASALAAVSGQVDSINNTYANLINDEKVAGTGRLGSTRASNARGGTLGSDFGNAAMDKTQGFNDQKVKALADEQNMKIQAILGGANKDAEDRITAEKATVDKNSQAWLNYLKDSGDKATEQLKAFAGAGGQIDQLSDTEYNHFVKATGMSPEQLKAMVTLNQPKDTVLHSEVQGNKYIQVNKDPITGKVSTSSIDLGFQVPPEYTVEKLANGQLAFYPKKLDPTKTLQQQILTYGPTTPLKTGTKAAKVFVDGGLKYTADDKAAADAELNAHRGADGYVDPAVYTAGFAKWTAAGGTPQGFAKEFPPASNVNPASNSIVPTQLRNTTVKKTSGRSG